MPKGLLTGFPCLVATCLLGACLAAHGVRAEAVEEFYKG